MFYFTTKKDLRKMEVRIMSTIDEKLNAHKQAMDAFWARLAESITNLEGDIQDLNDKIAVLQNSPGETWTAENQAVLDDIQLTTEKATVKLEALAALNPPPAPPVSPE